MFAPAKIKARSLSGESVAGPSVQMIFVLRMAGLTGESDIVQGILREVWKGKQVLFRSLSPGHPERKEENEKQQTTERSSKGLIAA